MAKQLFMMAFENGVAVEDKQIPMRSKKKDTFIKAGKTYEITRVEPHRLQRPHAQHTQVVVIVRVKQIA